jgi:hypothetical protein
MSEIVIATGDHFLTFWDDIMISVVFILVDGAKTYDIT